MIIAHPQRKVKAIKAEENTHRMGGYENRTGVVKKQFAVCFYVTCGGTHNLCMHMYCYTTVKKGAAVEGWS